MKKRVLILAAAVISVLSASSGVYLITTCGKGVGATVDRSFFETEEEWYQYKVAYKIIDSKIAFEIKDGAVIRNH